MATMRDMVVKATLQDGTTESFSIDEDGHFSYARAVEAARARFGNRLSNVQVFDKSELEN